VASVLSIIDLGRVGRCVTRNRVLPEFQSLGVARSSCAAFVVTCSVRSAMLFSPYSSCRTVQLHKCTLEVAGNVEELPAAAIRMRHSFGIHLGRGATLRCSRPCSKVWHLTVAGGVFCRVVCLRSLVCKNDNFCGPFLCQQVLQANCSHDAVASPISTILSSIHFQGLQFLFLEFSSLERHRPG
jgi:hypothetical protein